MVEKKEVRPSPGSGCDLITTNRYNTSVHRTVINKPMHPHSLSVELTGAQGLHSECLSATND